MKRINQKLMLMMAACLMALGFAACSSGDSDDFANKILGDYASKDNLIVMRLNYWEAAENAGFTRGSNRLNIPADIENLISRASQRDQASIRAVVSSQGIDPEAIIIIIDDTDASAVFMHVTDQGEFANTLSTLGMTQGADVDGYNVYSGGGNIILSKDAIAFFAPGSTPQQYIASANNLKEKATAAPLTAWQRNYLDEDDALRMMLNLERFTDMATNGEGIQLPASLRAQAAAFGCNIDEIVHGYTMIQGEIDGQEAELEGHVVNADGTAIRGSFGTAEIDTSMLKYANANDMFVMMCGMPGNLDWTALMNAGVDAALEENGINASEAEMREAREIVAKMGNALNAIDGTVIYTMGVDPNTLMSNRPSVHMVLAAQIKPAEVAAITTAVTDILNAASIPYTADGNNISFNIQGIPFRTQLSGNEFAIGTDINTNGGCRIPASTFRGEQSGLAISVPKTFPLLSMLGINYGIDFYVVSNGERAKAKLEITDTDTNLLTAIIKLAETSSRRM